MGECLSLRYTQLPWMLLFFGQILCWLSVISDLLTIDLWSVKNYGDFLLSLAHFQLPLWDFLLSEGRGKNIQQTWANLHSMKQMVDTCTTLVFDSQYKSETWIFNKDLLFSLLIFLIMSKKSSCYEGIKLLMAVRGFWGEAKSFYRRGNHQQLYSLKSRRKKKYAKRMGRNAETEIFSHPNVWRGFWPQWEVFEVELSGWVLPPGPGWFEEHQLSLCKEKQI